MLDVELRKAVSTVDEQLARGELWQHWADIVDFTVDGIRIGDRPPEPKTDGRGDANAFDTRLDPRYREVILVAHSLHRAGYHHVALRTGSPNRFEPDVYADVHGGVWIEHTDLLHERLAERTGNMLRFEARLREAIDADLGLQREFGDRYLTFSLQSAPTGRVLEELIADTLRFLGSASEMADERSPHVVTKDFPSRPSLRTGPARICRAGWLLVFESCCVVIYSSDDMLIGIVDLIRANEEYYSPQFQAACEMERFEVGGDDDQQPYWTSDLREAYIEAMRRLDALLDR